MRGLSWLTPWPWSLPSLSASSSSWPAAVASSSHVCGTCGARLTWAKTGRPRRYCSGACRVAAFRARKAGHAAGPPPAPLPMRTERVTCAHCGHRHEHLVPVLGHVPGQLVLDS